MNRTSGSKITSSHTSHIEVAKPLIKFAENESLVTKISVGIMKSVSKPSPKRLKILLEQACLLLKVRGNKYIQEIRFYSENLAELEQKVKKEAKGLGFIL